MTPDRQTWIEAIEAQVRQTSDSLTFLAEAHDRWANEAKTLDRVSFHVDQAKVLRQKASRKLV